MRIQNHVMYLVMYAQLTSAECGRRENCDLMLRTFITVTATHTQLAQCRLNVTHDVIYINSKGNNGRRLIHLTLSLFA